MLALLRVIVRTPAYRQHVHQLVSRQPDDIWYEEAYGWVVTFALQSLDQEQILLFTIRIAEGRVPIVTTVLRITRNGQHIQREVVS